jgi:2-(1,2-epoxy-1,2-dihydrophenyl)acetyl-CoA isomerase
VTSTVDGLLLDISGALATVTFNRPEKANYIDNLWLEPLRQFLVALATNPEVRCVLVQSTGKHFMAGGDLKFMDQMIAMSRDGRVGKNLEIIMQWDAVLSALLALPQPVVARVQGGVVGAPVGLIAACDLVVAGESAFLSVAHVHHAEAVSGLITYFLPRQIGYKKTMHLALLGDRIPAREAERLGLVSQVVADAELAAATDQLVARLLSGPTAAYALIKRTVLDSFENTRPQQAALEFIAASKSAATDDWEAGCDALYKRRKPQFTGR